MKFMDGVILIEECTQISVIGCIVFTVSIISVIILSYGSFYVGCIISEKKWSDVYMYVGGILGVIIALIGKIAIPIIPEFFQEPNDEYNVVIDTDVDMNEFSKRYEIVDFKDGIYTITLKDSREVQEDEIH